MIAPGSRNAPLSFAVYDAAEAGLLRLHTRIDERSAGFLALGLTRGGARAAVMSTSGTAVANSGPAVLEGRPAGRRRGRDRRPPGPPARHEREPDDRSGGDLRPPRRDPRPDRPPDRPRAGRALESLATRTAPVHLNVQLDEPLVPDGRWAPASSARSAPSGQRPEPSAPATTIPAAPRTVVVAGDDAGPPARVLAQRAGWPLLAEPTSGSRTGENALRCYRLLLDTELGERIERVVVFGHPTLSRPVTRLLARDDVEVLVVPAGSGTTGRTRSTSSSTGRWSPSVPTTRPGWSRGATRTAPWPAGWTRCSPPRRARRRTRSPGR